jgi:hypothetical protein
MNKDQVSEKVVEILGVITSMTQFNTSEDRIAIFKEVATKLST